MHNEITRSNRHKLKHEKFWLYTSGFFFSPRAWSNSGTESQRGFTVSVLGDTQKPIGQGPEQPSLTGPVLCRGWTRRPLEVPSNWNYLGDSTENAWKFTKDLGDLPMLGLWKYFYWKNVSSLKERLCSHVSRALFCFFFFKDSQLPEYSCACFKIQNRFLFQESSKWKCLEMISNKGLGLGPYKSLSVWIIMSMEKIRVNPYQKETWKKSIFDES